MFVGRNYEIEYLNKLYNSGKFELAVVYGRRRVGKTTLLNEFIKDKKGIYYIAEEQSKKLQIDSLSKSIFDLFEKPRYISEFNNYDEIFEYLIDKSNGERIILVFDEFPYMVNSDKSFLTKFQKYIDTKFKNTNIMIVLCGSSISFMENEVLANKSPIFGRCTAQMEIKPFDFFDAIKFYEKYDDIDKVIAYSIVGGVPQYLDLWNENVDIGDNIREMFLVKYRYLFDEPLNFLKQELREPKLYSSILKAISEGYSKLNEISTKIGEPYDKTAVYLKTLVMLRIVEKINPIFEKDKTKKSVYKIKDNLFKFIYRFVYPNIILIEQKKDEKIYMENIKPYINEFTGHIFEQVCKDYLMKKSKLEELPFVIEEIGTWWGTNNKLKIQEEIDIVCVSKNKAILCECKWRNEKVGIDVLDKLKRRMELLPNINEVYYYIFSKSGFKKSLEKEALVDDKIKLINISDIYK